MPDKHTQLSGYIWGDRVYSIQILSGDSIYVKIIHEADGPKRV